MQNILITGAASAIAQATAKLYAKQGASFYLIDRNTERLQTVADDLKVRGAKRVETAVVNLSDTALHESLLDKAFAAMPDIDTVLIAHGTLPKQEAAQQDWNIASQELTTNFLSGASLLTHLANRFEAKGSGTIAVISSVAGERGRQSNYVYGAAKGALTVFVSGLRNRLTKKGVHVVTIKPGFVDTPMTAEFKKGLLWVKPEVVAKSIKRAIETKKSVAYVPWFWRYIMLVIRNIPESIFRKMQL